DGHRCKLRGKVHTPNGEPLKPPISPLVFTFLNSGRQELALRGLVQAGAASGSPSGEPQGSEARDVEGKLDRTPLPLKETSERADLALAGGETQTEGMTLSSRVSSGEQLDRALKVTADSFFLRDLSAGIAIGGAASRGPHVLIASAEGDAREADLD